MERKRHKIRETHWLRTAWLASTCLSAFTFARAQTLAPDTTPQGGSVSAGSASIAQAPGSTVVTQTTPRAAINWQSFNIGGNAQVQFVQPSSSAIALNRVLTPEPSVIAGRLSANGQLVLINQSGVVFSKGAQVNAAGLLVSTANVADKDFMAGRLAFTGAPTPGATIVNNGTITIKDAGLAGFVAPQVANNGVITATLGQVELAGATAFTLDLYGDRMISLDVTQAVRAVDVGGKIVPALVTNRGLIAANGGKIILTAQDADALVTQLIDAGGTLRADSVGAQPGAISLQGVGGSFTIAGNLLARGTAAGTKGGTIEALTTGTVSVAPGAVIDSSGQAGGGLVALGTDIVRAERGGGDSAAPRAAAVRVASGALISATALHQGNAGRVVLLSSESTAFDGTIAAEGGALGGNGGTVEISSGGVVSLGGTVLDTAPHGENGEILFDPATLFVYTLGSPTAGSVSAGSTITFGTDSNNASYLTPAELNSLSGTIILEASTLIGVGSGLDLTAASALSLVSAGDIIIAAPITVTNGSLALLADGTLTSGAALTAADVELLNAGSGGVEITAPINAPGGTFMLVSDGFALASGTIGAAGGAIEIAPYNPLDGAISVPQAVLSNLFANTVVIGQAGSFVTNDLTSTDDLSYSGTLVFEAADNLTQSGTLTAASIELLAPVLAVGGSLSASGAVDLSGTGLLVDTGTINAATLSLDSAGLTESPAAIIDAGELEGAAGTGLLLTNSHNSIGGLGNLTIGAGGFSLVDQVPLTIAGTVGANQINLTDAAAGGISLGSAAALRAASGGITIAADALLAAASASLSAPGHTIQITPYTSGLGIDLGGSDDGLLDISANLLAAASAAQLQIGTSGSLVTEGAVTVTAGTLLLDAASVTFNAPLTAPGLLEVASGGISQSGLGAVTAGTLTSGGAAGEAVDLDEAPNQIGTLGGFDATGQSFALATAGALTVSGPVLFASGTLAADTLVLAGTVLAGSALALDGGAGGVSQTGGLLSAPTLTGTDGGTVSLLQTGNSIGAAGSLSLSGALALVDSEALTLGSLTAASATFTGPGLTFTADASLTGALALDTSGPVLQPIGGGHITAATLTGDASGLVSLTGGANINTLANFTLSGGALSLAGNAVALTLAGTIDVPTLVVSSQGLTEALDAALIAGSLNLSSPGAILSLASPFNQISSAAGLQAAQGTLTLVDATPLTISGPVSGPDVALTDTAPGGITLGTGGSVSVAAGGTVALTADALAAAAGGAISAPNGLVIAAPNTGGLAIDLGGTDPEALDLSPALVSAISAGTLQIGTGGGAILAENSVSASAGTLLLDGANLDLPGTLADPGGVIALVSSDAITQGASGGLQAATLTAQLSAGGLALTGSANSFATLGGLSALAGGLVVDDQGGLTLAALVSAADATLTAGQLSLASALTVNGVLDLDIAGGVAQSGFSLSAGTLTGSVAGTANLTGPDNAIGSLSGFTAANLALTDQTGLRTGTVNLQTGSLTAPGITLAGNVSVASALTLSSPDSITQTAGTLSAAFLAGGGGGAVSLTDAGNNIAALGGFSLNSGNALNVADSVSLTVNGPLVADTIALSAAWISLEGDVTGNDVQLQSPGGIGQASGTVSATLLTNNAVGGGTFALTDAGNSIGTLSNIAQGSGAFLLDDATVLKISNVLAAALVSLTAPGIELAGTLAATTLGLQSGSTFAQDAGSDLQFSTLTAYSVSSGGLVLDEPGALTVSGLVRASEIVLEAAGLAISGSLISPGDISLISSGAIDIAGLVQTGSALSLTAAGGIEGGGTLIAPLLTGTAAAGDIALTGPNSIATLGGLDATGAVDVNDAVALDEAGPVTGSAVTLAAAGLTVAGSISAGGAISLTGSSAVMLESAVSAGTDLALSSSGNVYETGADLTAGTLTGAVSGSANLTGSANYFLNLGPFTAGTLALVDQDALTAGPGQFGSAVFSAPGFAFTGAFGANALSLATAGAVTETGTAAITAGTESVTAGSIDLSGTDNVAGSLDLAASGGITATGRTSAGTLTGAAGGLVLFTGGAAFNTLGNFADPQGVFSLSNAGALTLAGALDPVAVRISTTGALTLAGGGSLVIGGSLAAGHATAPGPGDSVLAAGGALSQTGLFTVTGGPVTLFLESGAGISLAGLQAPSVDTVLDGTGKLTGSLNVAQLEILRGSSASLSGAIAGIATGAAAALATLDAAPSASYQFNACVIASATCTLPGASAAAVIQTSAPSDPETVFVDSVTSVSAAAQSSAATAPLENFSAASASSRKSTDVVLNVAPEEDVNNVKRKKKLDNNVQLPGVATHDY